MENSKEGWIVKFQQSKKFSGLGIEPKSSSLTWSHIVACKI